MLNTCFVPLGKTAMAQVKNTDIIIGEEEENQNRGIKLDATTSSSLIVSLSWMTFVDFLPSETTIFVFHI